MNSLKNIQFKSIKEINHVEPENFKPGCRSCLEGRRNRLSRSDEERALLPDNPDRMLDISDAELGDVYGGTTGLFCAAVTNFLPGSGGGTFPNTYAGFCGPLIA